MCDVKYSLSILTGASSRNSNLLFVLIYSKEHSQAQAIYCKGKTIVLGVYDLKGKGWKPQFSVKNSALNTLWKYF